MGSSASPVSEEFRVVFRAHVGPDGAMSFAQFMEVALYHPEVGYYRKNRARVGYGAGTDFFTASTSGPIFGELVVAAAVKLLAGHDPKNFTFVEVGAEPDGDGVLTGVSHPFGAARTVRVGGRAELNGRCVVFSNELFDAQPFRRFVFRAGSWLELGVALVDDRLAEIELPNPGPKDFPQTTSEGYVIDAPLAAAELLDQWASSSWSGVFMACDYGKSWQELTEATPHGTARAYFQHTQSNDLLARPGEQDLTCHVCWDWLASRLTVHGFAFPALHSQESFFVKYAGDHIAAVSLAEAARFSQKKLSLMQLLHPANLGQKFQVLHATRGLEPGSENIKNPLASPRGDSFISDPLTNPKPPWLESAQSPVNVPSRAASSIARASRRRAAASAPT